MELKPGYQQTEFGVIPDDWDVVPLGRLITSVEYGSSAKSSPSGSVPVLRMGNLQNGKIDWSDLVYTNDVREIEKYSLRAGDVLFNRTNTIDLVGKTSIYLGEQPAVFAGYLIRVNVNKEQLDSRYLNYTLNTEVAKKYGLKILSVAVGQANINGQKLKTYPVPLPPTHAEQSAIATALGDIDSLLGALAALIEKKRAIKQGTMQELLTGNRRLPGFLGAWTVRRLSDIANIQRGASPRPIDSPLWFDDNSHVGWVRISDVTGSGMYLEETTQRLSQAGIQHSRPVSAGNLIMSICATVGRPIITQIDTCIHDGFVVFDDLSTDQKFLYYVLKWIEPNWSKHGQTGSQMNLNTGLINRTALELPALDEQQAIAAVLSAMDADILALGKKREKVMLLKQGMMQELLTGKTRLVEPVVRSMESSSNVIPFKTKNDDTKRGGLAAEEIGGKRANVHFKRSVFAAEIVDQLHNEPTFGHVKFEKLIFLAEHLCGVDTGSQYHRDAAGPYDNRALRSIDSQLKKRKWFDAQKLGGRYQYVPLEKQGGHKEYFERYYDGISARLDEIIAIFRTAKTDQCEIVATLYGAWADLINLGQPVTDESILDQVLNHWHDKKREIPEQRWRKALEWMREKGYVPDGAQEA